MKKLKFIAIMAAVAIIAGGAIILSSGKKAGAASNTESYVFATIVRGTIESVVSSSGTLSVVSSVGVLAQMSGRLETVAVDFNDRVRKGQVLATINTDLLRLQAKVAQAAVDKALANYDLQLLAARNAERLFEKSLLSEYDLKTSQSTFDVCRAELSSARASLEEIETEINQYAIITSPIDGIVLERDIDEGQSVVGGSSSSSTSLFTIAEDLAKMQIKAEVDELDIGSIKVGQDVRFTVEADPGRTFAGTVKEIRLVPETTDNVVYYCVIILADNESGKLLPGMTASVSFIKQRKDDILVVPSAAFRFTPTSLSSAEIRKAVFMAGLGELSAADKAAAEARYDDEQKALAAAAAGDSSTRKVGGLSSLMGGGGPGFGGPPGTRSSASSSQASQSVAASTKKTLWYMDESGRITAALIDAGIGDGSKTEIVGAENLEGASVIVKIRVE
ncbi:MAG: efflux RND transporter periplasmic adaptor subunit [Spirochaetes bacterium]|nr:efflux RND transporter periplasmic adaptor subunit [Spirochaetota bacterium]